jgi:hypothetical protein
MNHSEDLFYSNGQKKYDSFQKHFYFPNGKMFYDGFHGRAFYENGNKAWDGFHFDAFYSNGKRAFHSFFKEVFDIDGKKVDHLLNNSAYCYSNFQISFEQNKKDFNLTIYINNSSKVTASSKQFQVYFEDQLIATKTK